MLLLRSGESASGYNLTYEIIFVQILVLTSVAFEFLSKDGDFLWQPRKQRRMPTTWQPCSRRSPPGASRTTPSASAFMKSSRRPMPDLKPRLWYGMPGYAKDGPVLVFFRVDDYMTFGLTEKANFTIEDGATNQLMACAWFFTELDDATEAKIADIVRVATS